MSSTAKLIVTCPACSSSFQLSEDSKLEESLLSQVSSLIKGNSQEFSAKFHCSSCDFSFNSDLKTEHIVGKNPISSQPTFDSYTQTNQEDFTNESEITPPEDLQAQEVDYFNEPTTSDHTQVVDQDILEDIRSEGSSRLSFTDITAGSNSWDQQDLWGEKDESKDQAVASDSFQLNKEDRSSLSSLPTSSAHTTYSVNQDIQHEDYSKYAVNSFAEAQSSSKNDMWRDSADTEGFKPAGMSSRESAQTLHSTPAKSLFAQPGSISDQLSAIDSMSTSFSDNNFTGSSSSSRQPNFESYADKETIERSAGSTVTLLVLPILLVLAGLSYLTFHLENNLKSADSAFNFLFPSSLREPPAGLFILEPSIRPLVLDSGDIVNVVQGKIVNKTKKTLDSIQLEGLGFSASGQLNNREKIMLGNPVSIRTVKLKTLTPSNIREIQSRDVKKALKLRPSSDMDFVFVFTDPVSPRVLDMPEQKNNGRNDSLNSDMSSFALRIFAVR